jgi:hypothetical protein
MFPLLGHGMLTRRQISDAGSSSQAEELNDQTRMTNDESMTEWPNDETNANACGS